MAPRKTAVSNARKAAAVGAPVLVQYEGHEYVIQPAEDWDIDVLEAQENEQYITMLKLILGDEQYRAWKGRGRKVKEFNDFVTAILHAVGSPNS